MFSAATTPPLGLPGFWVFSYNVPRRPGLDLPSVPSPTSHPCFSVLQLSINPRLSPLSIIYPLRLRVETICQLHRLSHHRHQHASHLFYAPDPGAYCLPAPGMIDLLQRVTEPELTSFHRTLPLLRHRQSPAVSSRVASVSLGSPRDELLEINNSRPTGHALRRNAGGAFGPDLAKKLSQLVKMEKNVMRSLETVARERMEVAVCS